MDRNGDLYRQVQESLYKTGYIKYNEDIEQDEIFNGGILEKIVGKNVI